MSVARLSSSGVRVLYRANNLDARCAAALFHSALGSSARIREVTPAQLVDLPLAGMHTLVLIGLLAPAAVDEAVRGAGIELITLHGESSSSLASRAWALTHPTEKSPRGLAHLDEKFASGPWTWGSPQYLRCLAQCSQLGALARWLDTQDDELYFHALATGKYLLEADQRDLSVCAGDAQRVRFPDATAWVAMAPARLAEDLDLWLARLGAHTTLIWSLTGNPLVATMRLSPHGAVPAALAACFDGRRDIEVPLRELAALVRPFAQSLSV